MTESAYQAKLIKQYEAQGWTVLKLIQLNKSGYPDLLCLKPDKVLFIEVKGPKGRLSKVQEYRIEELRSKGFVVEVKQIKPNFTT
jgi:Holliday junction resolvase